MGSIADFGGGLQCEPIPSPIDAADLGKVTLSPLGAFEAGSFATFSLHYTAGRYGIDDSGSIRICFRFASDQMRPQFDRPADPRATSLRGQLDDLLLALEGKPHRLATPAEALRVQVLVETMLQS